MKIFKYLFFLFALLFSSTIYSQALENNIGSSYTETSNSGNDTLLNLYSTTPLVQNKIWLTNDSAGAVPTDILYYNATNKVFVYGKRNVVVVDASTMQIIARIPISDNSQFYPAVEQPYDPSYSLSYNHYLKSNHLVYDSDKDLIYCIGENFKVYSINPNNYSINTIFDIEQENGYSYYYNSFIKYDTRNKLLFIAFSTYLVNKLYIVDPNQNYVQTDYLNLNADGIRALVLNETSNYFYMSINKSFYKYSYNSQGVISTSPTLINSYSGSNDFAGNMIYVKTSSIQKLFCFPNAYNYNQTLNYFMVDLNSNDLVQSKPCPASVTSVCFNGSDKLFISYKSNNGNADFRVINAINNSVIGNDVDTRQSSINGLDVTLDMKMINGKVLLTKESEVVVFNPANSSKTQLYQGENNYFYRTTVHNNKAYVIGTWSTVLERYSENNRESMVNIGGIVYKACHNPAKGKIYFYNTHRQEHGKVYILNKSSNMVNIVEMPASIADIEIDPLTNNALVSSNDNSYLIRVIDGSTDLLRNDLQITMNHNHIGELFVAPNNYLYCLITQNTNNTPGIEIKNLNNTSSSDYITYNVNSGEKLVGYFTASSQTASRSETVTVYAAVSVEGSTSYGKAYRISEPQFSSVNTSINPGVMDIDYLPGDGNVYIANKTSSGGLKNLTVIDNNWGTPANLTFSGSIKDIEVNPDKNRLYVLYQTVFETVIGKVSNGVIENDIIDGLAINTNSMKYSQSNNALYLYAPVVGTSCTNYTSGIIYEVFDNKGGAEIKGYEVGDVQRSRYILSVKIPIHHDIIIDPFTNIVYCGGGGHSCINTFEPEYFHVLPLRSNITWLSFPRHIRNVDDETTTTPQVLNNNNISGSYNQLDLQYNSITTTLNNSMTYARWYINGTPKWYFDPDMENINSLRGYKLQIWPNQSRTLTLHGATEDPSTPLTIYTNAQHDLENWVGYWLYEEQSPFEAIPQNVLNVLTSIKAQDWYCYRDNPGSKSSEATGSWLCALNIGVNSPRLKYGDMVILRSDATISFQWQNNYSASPGEVKSATTYYQYAEEPDYTPYMIDIDTANRPQEIGAFIGDSCIGATTVLPDDTLVLIRGYDKNTTGDVFFKNHYTTKNSDEVLNKYYIKTPGNRKWKMQTINAGKRIEYYRISFKAKKSTEPEQDNEPLLFDVYPNPATNSLTVQYHLTDNSKVAVTIYDVTGRKVTESHWEQPKGLHQNSINTRALKNGIYLLRISSGNLTAVKRFVIDK